MYLHSTSMERGIPFLDTFRQQKLSLNSPLILIARLRVISIIASNDQLSNKMLFQVKMINLHIKLAYIQEHLKLCHINSTKYIVRSSDN